MTEDFDWDGGDVLLRSYGDVAVFVNGHGDISIGQRAEFGPYATDQIVCIPRHQLAVLIARLQELV